MKTVFFLRFWGYFGENRKNRLIAIPKSRFLDRKTLKSVLIGPIPKILGDENPAVENPRRILGRPEPPFLQGNVSQAKMSHSVTDGGGQVVRDDRDKSATGVTIEGGRGSLDLCHTV